MAVNEPESSRLQRLEEAHGFAERAIEQLSEEIASLNRRLAAMQVSLRAVEGRLKALSEPPEELEA
jgi:uncharacterized coiled-coil protein SlyX